MPPIRKAEWIRPTDAARILGKSRQTVLYRAGKGLYASKHDADTGVTLVSRKDVERDAKREKAA
jgi:hypothetical protein